MADVRGDVVEGRKRFCILGEAGLDASGETGPILVSVIDELSFRVDDKHFVLASSRPRHRRLNQIQVSDFRSWPISFDTSRYSVTVRHV